MLILTRKIGEKIILKRNLPDNLQLDDITQEIQLGDIIIQIIEVKGKQVRVGIDAPKEIKIIREELNDNNRK